MIHIHLHICLVFICSIFLKSGLVITVGRNLTFKLAESFLSIQTHWEGKWRKDIQNVHKFGRVANKQWISCSQMPCFFLKNRPSKWDKNKERIPCWLFIARRDDRGEDSLSASVAKRKERRRFDVKSPKSPPKGRWEVQVYTWMQ